MQKKSATTTRSAGKKAAQNKLIAEKTTLLLAAGARLFLIAGQLEPIIKNSIATAQQQELRAALAQYIDGVNYGAKK